MRRLACCAVLLALGSTSCALTSKADPVMPRYFNPALASTARSAAAAQRGVKLRLHRVEAGSHIKHRIVHRDSSYEVGFYDERRWAEMPDVSLRRALGRVLYEELGLRRVVSGRAPTLEVELLGFEEIRTPTRKARVVIVALLHDDGAALFEETIVVERPVEESDELDEWEQLAKALGEALRDAVDQVGQRVVVGLGGGGSPSSAAAAKPKSPPEPKPQPAQAPPES